MLTREIPAGTVSTWAGEGGIGKTYAGLDTAICIGLGISEYWREGTKPIGPRRVLYFDAENGERLITARLHALLRGRGLDPIEALGDNVIALDGRGYNLDTPGDYKAIQKEIELVEPSLLVLDSAMALTSSDALANKDVREFLDRKIRPLTKEGMAVKLQHHVRKLTGIEALDKGAQAVMGARAWIDAADEVFTFHDGGEKRVNVIHVKGRTCGTLPPFFLGLSLPPHGTQPEDMVSCIKDIGGLASPNVPKAESARVAITALMQDLKARGATEIDEYTATATECHPNTAKTVRIQMTNESKLLPVNDGGRHPKYIWNVVPNGGK